MSWNISKEFDFCFGHRVWSQTLDKKLSVDDTCKCRHLHGHQGKIVVHLKSDELNNGMVTDFNHLNWFKRFIDTALDHKFIIDKNDPLIDVIIPDLGQPLPWDINPFYSDADFTVINPNFTKFIEHNYIIELLESFVRVDFVPTSENICKWLYQYIHKAMGDIVSGIEFYESPKSRCLYSP